MKQLPPAFTASPALWASSKPPLLRFLDRCHADFSAETGGAVADYIPELGKADPAHFGVSLATLDGHVGGIELALQEPEFPAQQRTGGRRPVPIPGPA